MPAGEDVGGMAYWLWGLPYGYLVSDPSITYWGWGLPSAGLFVVESFLVKARPGGFWRWKRPGRR
jgi:hypothetical protein